MYHISHYCCTYWVTLPKLINKPQFTHNLSSHVQLQLDCSLLTLAFGMCSAPELTNEVTYVKKMLHKGKKRFSQTFSSLYMLRSDY